MAKDPAFLFYPGDYLGGTMGFSLEQHGMYLMLLIFQFNNKHFDCDTAQNICNGKFESVKSKFCFDEITGTYYNSRLREEMEKRAKYSQSRRDNVAKRYENATHEEDMNNTSITHVLHMEDENEDINKNKDINKEIEEIYKLYPSADKNNNRRPTGKCSKDKDKILKLLKSIGFEQLKLRIEDYLKNCDRTKEWLKNFSVLLNNLPEITEEAKSEENKKAERQWYKA